jgi:hypothetical protein
MIQEERSIFPGVIVSVSDRKKVHVNMCLILTGYRDEIELFESPDLIPLDFSLCGWMKAKFTKERWIHETNCSLAFWMLLPA